MALAGCANRGMKADGGVQSQDRGIPSADDHNILDVVDAGSDAPEDLTAMEAAAEVAPPAPDAQQPDAVTDAPVGEPPRDAGADGPRDTGRGDAGCPARFNFENGATYMARNNNTCASCLLGFTAVANSTAKPLCGSGALEISAAFSGTTGKTTGGEIILPLATSEDMTGKTITISVAALPNGANNLSFSLILGTSVGYQTVVSFSSVTDTYATKSLTLTPDGGVGGIDSVSQLSLEAFSTTGYAGKIYVDELDIR